MNRFITTGQAAREIGVSAATLTRWVQAGKVRPAETTAGGHHRWVLSDLRAQVRAIRGLPAEPADERRRLAEDIASVIHDCLRRYQIVLGDPVPSPLWDDAPQRQIDGAVESVLRLLDAPGRTAEENHQGWLDDLTAAGWTRGDVKSEEAKTHPLLVPFHELPLEEKRKDYAFVAIVRALTAGGDDS